MSISTINVAILGSGPLADLTAKRITARPGLTLTGTVANTEAPPADTSCIVYLPTDEKPAAIRITELLRDGFNVVSTIPAESLDKAELLESCQRGSAT